MTCLRLAGALALLMICWSNSTAADFSFPVVARDPGVNHWISYQILGPRNHPFPMVYISTRHFKTTPPEFIIVMPQKKYGIISAYTQARMARADCPGKEPVGNVWHSVEIAEHDKKAGRQCVLPQAMACEYFSAVVSLVGIAWTAEKLRPINDFNQEIDCSSISRH